MSDSTILDEIIRDGDRVRTWTEEERERARITIVGAGVEADDMVRFDRRAESDALADIAAASDYDEED